jgi:SAM-dependent methyltransferase
MRTNSNELGHENESARSACVQTTPMDAEPSNGPARVAHRDATPAESAQANRLWWDANASDYYAEHGGVLGDADLLWCPEGLREADARLLGDVEGLSVLEVGGGAAQGGRWLTTQGARVTALDVSRGQLQQSRRLDVTTGVPVPALVQADAQRLPFLDASFDVVMSAFGGIPFVADSAGTMRELARVARPGARVVFSVTHPLRWAFPDDPGPAGLTVRQSYFDRTPYVEEDAEGRAVYVEHHRTLGDRIRELVAAGLVLDDLIEPEWPEGRTQEWGQWSPLRGGLVPGTAIFLAHKGC